MEFVYVINGKGVSKELIRVTVCLNDLYHFHIYGVNKSSYDVTEPLKLNTTLIIFWTQRTHLSKHKRQRLNTGLLLKPSQIFCGNVRAKYKNCKLPPTESTRKEIVAFTPGSRIPRRFEKNKIGPFERRKWKDPAGDLLRTVNKDWHRRNTSVLINIGYSNQRTPLFAGSTFSLWISQLISSPVGGNLNIGNSPRGTKKASAVFKWNSQQVPVDADLLQIRFCWHQGRGSHYEVIIIRFFVEISSWGLIRVVLQFLFEAFVHSRTHEWQ